MNMKNFIVASDPIEQGKEAEFKFIPGEEVKGVQLNPEKVEAFKKALNIRNEKGVELVVFPNGARGLKVTGEDGTEILYQVLSNGKIVEVFPYKDTYLDKSFSKRLERFFGLTHEMEYTNSSKINLVHALMFGVATAVVGGLAALVAFLLR